MTDLSEREAARAIILEDLQLLAFFWEERDASLDARITLSDCIERIQKIDLTQESPGLIPWGRLVRAWRIERGLILADMADELGIAYSTLSGYEMGRKVIPEEIALKVEAMMFPNGPAAHHAKDLSD